MLTKNETFLWSDKTLSEKLPMSKECCWPLDFSCQIGKFVTLPFPTRSHWLLVLSHQIAYLAAGLITSIALFILNLYLCLPKNNIDSNPVSPSQASLLTPNFLANLLSKMQNVDDFSTSSPAPVSTSLNTPKTKSSSTPKSITLALAKEYANKKN